MNLGAFDPHGPIVAEMNFLFWLLVGLGTAVFLAFAALGSTPWYPAYSASASALGSTRAATSRWPVC